MLPSKVSRAARSGAGHYAPSGRTARDRAPYRVHLHGISVEEVAAILNQTDESGPPKFREQATDMSQRGTELWRPGVLHTGTNRWSCPLSRRASPSFSAPEHDQTRRGRS